MFVRFRQTRRLQVSLIETRRVAGKVRHEHVASLGATDTPPSVADRVAFWQGLHERLGRLSNRLDTTAQAKILGEVHARIPMVPIAEQRALQLENAEADQRLWERLRDMHQGTADDNKALAKTVDGAIANAEAGAGDAGARAEAAKDRVARIKKGEAVDGGLGKPMTREDVIKHLGLTPSQVQHMVDMDRVSQLGGFEEVQDETLKLSRRASRAAVRNVLRRRLRQDS